MRKLIAKTNILYRSILFAEGDELPTNDLTMVDAWIKAGTACFRDDDKGVTERDTLDVSEGEATVTEADTVEEVAEEVAEEVTPEEVTEEVTKTIGRGRKK